MGEDRLIDRAVLLAGHNLRVWSVDGNNRVFEVDGVYLIHKLCLKEKSVDAQAGIFGIQKITTLQRVVVVIKSCNLRAQQRDQMI